MDSRSRRYPNATLSVGTDLVHINEISASLAEFGRRYLERVYTSEELEYCMRDPKTMPERLAARFAAKEATFKVLALADAALPWKSVSVCRSESGACRLELSGEALGAAERLGYTAFSVSLTHECDYASAIVLGQRG